MLPCLLEAVLKPHLRLPGGVAGLLYSSSRRWRDCAFSSTGALPTNLIWGSETASIVNPFILFSIIDIPPKIRLHIAFKLVAAALEAVGTVMHAGNKCCHASCGAIDESTKAN
jgi:hypothetical protein